MSELEDWLFVTTAEDFSIRIAYGGSNQIPLDLDTIESITEEIVSNRIDVAIFDPLVSVHEVPENTNGCMDTVVRTLDRIAGFCNCAIDVPHHPRKGANGAEADRTIGPDDSRGAGSIRAAARGQRIFNRMTRKEAEDANIPEDEREFHIRVHRGKANYVPPATQAKWYKLTNVRLPNGDDVGGLVSWAYPTQAGPEQAATRDKADHVFLDVLRRYNATGRRVSTSPKGVFAPKEFANAPEAEGAKLCQKDMEGAMRRLLDTNRIHVATSRERGKNTASLLVGPHPGDDQ
jgi:RecA-family ATPase